jgi:hypothetical protein
LVRCGKYVSLTCTLDVECVQETVYTVGHGGYAPRR